MTDPSTQMASAHKPLAPPLVVWLLSPFHTGSHQAWAEGYQRYSQHKIRLLTLSGRFWKWRMQGGAIELAQQVHKGLAQIPPNLEMPDVVLATDMVHLPVWIGLLRRTLPATLPLVCYMHENQLTYPWRAGEKPDLTYAMINWLSQLTADLVLFNSQYHLESWFTELPRLLKQYPDYNHPELVALVRNRAAVAPVGIATEALGRVEQNTHQPKEEKGVAELDQPPTGKVQAPLILWNQRWEHDKRPDRFFALLYRLQEAGIAFRLAVAGESFRNVPPEFAEARQRLADRIVHWGYVATRTEYVALLQQADLVISTADHEFFGISVLEAVAAGAFPLLPARLSYPELIPAALHAVCLYANEDELWQKAVQFLTAPQLQPHPALQELRRHIASTYSWPIAARQTDEWLATVVAQRHAADTKQVGIVRQDNS